MTGEPADPSHEPNDYMSRRAARQRARLTDSEPAGLSVERDPVVDVGD